METCRAIDQIGDENDAIRVHAKRAKIECLVMKRAEGKPVALLAGTTGLVPSDVSCFERDWQGPQLHVEPADRTRIFIGDKDSPSKLGVPFLTSIGFEREANRYEDVETQRLGKMAFEEACCDFDCNIGIGYFYCLAG